MIGKRHLGELLRYPTKYYILTWVAQGLHPITHLAVHWFYAFFFLCLLHLTEIFLNFSIK